MPDSRILEIDFTNPNKVKSAYDVKKYDVVRIITPGNGNDFIEGIESATATGSILTIKVSVFDEQGNHYPSKTVKFKNIRDDLFVEAWGKGVNYYGSTFEEFYFNPKFGNTEKTWLSKPSSTSVTGTAFGEDIDLSGNGVYTPTAKNLKKKVGVKINAAGGNDTITGTEYNDTLTGGVGADTFIYKKGIDTIADAEKEDVIKIVDANVKLENLNFVKNGNNLEIVVDDENKIIVKNHFKQNGKDKVDSLVINENDSEKISEQTFIIKGKKNIQGTNFDDVITGSASADKITTGYGEDTITAGKGNDKITINGSGEKDIIISREDGNDTITLDLDDVLVDSDIKIILDDLYGKAAKTDYAIAKNKQDITITNEYEAIGEHKAVKQVITVKNYFKNVEKANLTVNGVDVYAELLADNEEEATETRGTMFDDVMTGTNSADVIYAYAGNDKIIASKGNDKIYGGDGNDTYVYDGFTDYSYGQTPSLGHDTIYNSSGVDTISIVGIEDDYEMANYFEPKIVHEISRVYPSYVDNQYYGHPHWFKKGNDLILSPYALYDENDKFDDSDVNTITLKDYFKAGKDGFGVKYMDNGLASDDEGYERINILDHATLLFDGNETPNLISWLKPNNFTGTFMNDIIRGNSKPDTLRGGDGNDIIYGNYSNWSKDKLYGDAGNDIIFASDAYAYGGTGNDIFVSDHLDGADIISDEAGYDRLSLRNRQYLTYFDVTQKNGEVTSTGDIYIKDISKDIDAIREVSKTNKVLKYKEDGNLDLDEYGRAQYDYVGGKVDAVVARYAGRPAFEVSDAYYNQLKKDPTILENFNDYGANKKYLDGYALANYKAREGYKLVFANWDFYVKDYDYDYHGTNVTAETSYDNYKDNQYPANYLYQTDEDYVEEHKNLVGIKENDDFAWDRAVYGLNKEQVDTYGIRAILQNSDMGVVIKNGTNEATAIETISLDRGAVDPTVSGVDSKVDNMAIGDYSQAKIDDVAAKVAKWLYDNNYSSVKDAISKGDENKLKAMFDLFDGVYEWTENVKFRRGSYAEATSEYGGKIVGTAIIEDDDIIGKENDSTYELSFTHSDRASMISDYSGNDELILDYNEDGYSFLFDVEVDKNGKLVNYSRDFYVKFAGEEGNNTGVTICNGRETRHAIETVSMKNAKGTSTSVVFSYNQAQLDSVRQNVAGWLANNDYGSVQDVLSSGNEADINSMMMEFAQINNYQPEV